MVFSEKRRIIITVIILLTLFISGIYLVYYLAIGKDKQPKEEKIEYTYGQRSDYKDIVELVKKDFQQKIKDRNKEIKDLGKKEGLEIGNTYEQKSIQVSIFDLAEDIDKLKVILVVELVENIEYEDIKGYVITYTLDKDTQKILEVGGSPFEK